MKKIVILAVVAAFFSASCATTPKVDVDVELPSAAEVDSVSYLIGINFGSFIKGYDFGDVNLAQVKKGMLAFINAEGDQTDPDFTAQFDVDPNEMNRIFNDYLTKRQNYVAAVNKAEGEAFLEANKAKDGVEVTESGLQYKIINEGNDVKASATDTVWVHYRGTLLDGTQFDASPAEGAPVQMMLNRVIKGWTEGLQLVGEGGKIELYIPSDLAYGERGNRSIKPNSTLIFEVEVTKVGKVAQKEEK